MRVLSVSANDRAGGAAIGAYRLHQALRSAGVDSQMLVWRKVTSDEQVHRLADHLSLAGRARRRLAAWRHGRRLRGIPRRADAGHWSLNLYDYPIAAVINDFGADIVHLQWVGDNFLPIGEVPKIKAPVVWTLRDMWAFGGGPHYTGLDDSGDDAGNCERGLGEAGDDICARVFRAKQSAWADTPLSLVCISRWLADCAGRSDLFRSRQIEVIGNPIDCSVFKPLDRAAARHAFNLPKDKRLILFGAIGGASDRRKGFDYLRAALGGEVGDCELVVFGEERPADLGLALPTHQVGSLRDEVSLSLLYSACDVYVLPTLQEGLGNTLIEALACGTPCVTFDGTGASDVVRHQRDGYLARRRDSGDLAAGINWVLGQAWSRRALHEGVGERFGEARIAGKYIELYRSLLGGGV